MLINKELLDSLSASAKASERLRMNYDLRNSPDDGSQRMLNAMEPGTVLPVHRHRTSSELVAVVRGSVRLHIYDESGQETGSFVAAAGSDLPAFVVSAWCWHKTESLESGTVILETKDGKYEPLAEEDILKIG